MAMYTKAQELWLAKARVYTEEIDSRLAEVEANLSRALDTRKALWDMLATDFDKKDEYVAGIKTQVSNRFGLTQGRVAHAPWGEPNPPEFNKP